jgi:hypothetical protein
MFAIVAGLVQRRGEAMPRLLFDAGPMTSALTCLACAALIPFFLFANMGPPDARFIQPALWLGVASLRYRRRTLNQLVLVVALVALVLAVNVSQFARVQPLLMDVFETLQIAVPAEARVYSVTVRSPPRSLREAIGGSSVADFTVSMPILDYFDLYRFMAQSRYHASLGMFGIAWLANKPSGAPAQLTFAVAPRRNLQSSANAILEQARGYDVVELFGYSQDLRDLETLLVPAFHPVYRGTYFSLLARNQALQ